MFVLVGTYPVKVKPILGVGGGLRPLFNTILSQVRFPLCSPHLIDVVWRILMGALTTK